MRPTNQQFATNNESFREACEKADTPPTKRQAAKWRGESHNPGKRRGLAFLESLKK